jgi:hypothetical protein
VVVRFTLYKLIRKTAGGSTITSISGAVKPTVSPKFAMTGEKTGRIRGAKSAAKISEATPIRISATQIADALAIAGLAAQLSQPTGKPLVTAWHVLC